MTRRSPCNRFTSDGERCHHLTDNADGWCRQPDCGGFLRRSTSSAPESSGAPRGTPAHIAKAVSPRPAGIDAAWVDGVRVAQRAVDGFLFHHGGDRVAAVTEMHVMLEDFSLRGVGRETSGGFLVLARDGYEIVLSPDRAAVTSYSTMHRERTWSQLKAGVRSRFGKARRNPDRPGPPLDGAPVVLEPPGRILALLDPDRIHLTGSAFARGAQLMKTAGEEGDVEDFLRRSLADDVASSPTVERSDTGAHLVRTSTRTWIVRPDLLVVIGIRPV